MKKKAKQKPINLGPPEGIEEYGQRFVSLGEALQDDNTQIGDLYNLSKSCGLKLKLWYAGFLTTQERVNDDDCIK